MVARARAYAGPVAGAFTRAGLVALSVLVALPGLVAGLVLALILLICILRDAGYREKSHEHYGREQRKESAKYTHDTDN